MVVSRAVMMAGEWVVGLGGGQMAERVNRTD